MKLLKFPIYLSTLLLCLSTFSLAQDLNQAIPFPKETKMAYLDNGLQYIIHPNKIPEKKLELRLVLRIGSVLESPQQKGMAHFLEHMAFNGTQAFPNNQLTEALRAIGVKYGIDLNAYTGYNKTVYILPLPTDKPENIELGLSILKEWLSGLSIASQEVENEKGIIVQEIKDYLQADPFYALKVQDSKYAQGIPIGTPKDIAKINAPALKDFYHTWYRPDLASIIAVGDVDPTKFEQQLKEVFNSVPKAVRPKPRLAYGLAHKGGFQYQITSLKEGEKPLLELIFPHQTKPTKQFNDLRNELIDKLVNQLIDTRLKTIDSLPARYSDAWYLADTKQAVFEFQLKPKASPLTLIAKLGKSLAQIKQHGFLPSELEKAKAKILKRSTVKHTGPNSSSYWAAYFVDCATTGEHFVSDAQRHALYEQEMSSIDSDALVAHLDKIFSDEARCLFLYRDSLEQFAAADSLQIETTWRKALNTQTQAYIAPEEKEKDNENPILETVEFKLPELKPVGIESEKYYPELKLTELKLANGLRLAFKPMPMAEKKLSIHYFSRGGFAWGDTTQLPNLMNTTAYADMGGLGMHSYDELSELMYQLEVNVISMIGDYHHALLGTAPSERMEELMQVFYLKITEQKFKQEDFDEVIQEELKSFERSKSFWEEYNKAPFNYVEGRIAAITGSTSRINTEYNTKEEMQEKAKLSEIIAFYQKLYTSPMGKTVLITGNFNLEQAKQWAVQYFGSIPVSKSQGTPTTPYRGTALLRTELHESYGEPKNERVNLQYVFPFEYQHSLKSSLELKIMRELIQQELILRLREQQAIVYSPFANVKYSAYPLAKGHFILDFSCEIQHQALAQQEILKLIQDFQKETPRQDEIDKIIQSFLVTKRSVLTNTNSGKWREILTEQYLENESVEDFDNYQKIIKSITPQDIQAGFNVYLNVLRYATFTINN